MVVLGTDAHKRSHTIVAVTEAGSEIDSVTVAATPEGHLRLVKWAAQFEQRRWAIEDCRALSRRLEADPLQVGELVVRVPPKLMAGARRSARQMGKSDPIDALSVARAALREPDLPVARLDCPSREGLSSSLCEVVVHVVRSRRPAKVITNALSACFHPWVPVPSSPPLLFPMLRMAR